MNDKTQELARELAAPIIQAHKRGARFNSRNRSAFKRMNRPSRLEQMEKGGKFIYGVLARAGI